jgi:dTDP-glucose pyrophosphorylase
MSEILLIKQSASINEAINLINKIGQDKTSLFVMDGNKLVGSVTDGDIRRGLINGYSINDTIMKTANTTFKYLLKSDLNYQSFKKFREAGIRYVPILNADKTLVEIFDLEKQMGQLPIHAFLMAGGEGQRLRPLTEHVPKPLLKVGGEAIILRNIKRLKKYGITEITIAVKYLADKIISEIGNGEQWGVNINYILEKEALGTAGALSLQKVFGHETILLMNSDLLTNIDFEDLYDAHLKAVSSITVATIPYRVDVPFAVFELDDNRKVRGFKEKPTYNYEANSGIYLLKKSVVTHIPMNEKFDATDLMEKIIAQQEIVITYPITSYWLDIGRMSDYDKAQNDIHQIKF